MYLLSVYQAQWIDDDDELDDEGDIALGNPFNFYSLPVNDEMIIIILGINVIQLLFNN